MGSYIFSYGIKTKEIQNVFGSKNKAILNRIQSGKTFQYYESGRKDSSISLTNALAEIIKGRSMSDKIVELFKSRPMKEMNDDIYGYALVCICASLGTELPYNQDIKFGNDTRLVNKILTEDFGIKDFDIERILIGNSHTFPISKTLEPNTSIVYYKELTTIKNKLSSVHITDEKIQELAIAPDDREYGYEQLRGLIQNINFCIDQGLDLISFCH